MSGKLIKDPSILKIGDMVDVFISKRFKISDKVIRYNQWLCAVVIPGYRHGDGVLSVYTLKKSHNGQNCDGHGWGIGWHWVPKDVRWCIHKPPRKFTTRGLDDTEWGPFTE